jgi:uncharacterized protein (TIGR00369 family)
MTQTQPSVESMTGLEQLRAAFEGRLPPPPIAETVGINGWTLAEGSVSVSLTPQLRHYNPLGTVHGGVVSTLLDTACGCSVHSTLAPGELYTSLDLTVKFLRPVTVDTGRVTATGRVLQRGRRTALAEAQLHDAAGKLLAHATSSCMILS